jgi:hypothetical protein
VIFFIKNVAFRKIAHRQEKNRPFVNLLALLFMLGNTRKKIMASIFTLATLEPVVHNDAV